MFNVLKDLQTEVREVAKKWSEIYERSKKFNFPTKPEDMIRKRAYWDFVPGWTNITDGCYCVWPFERAIKSDANPIDVESCPCKQ